jgi:hypothetical protein
MEFKIARRRRSHFAWRADGGDSQGSVVVIAVVVMAVVVVVTPVVVSMTLSVLIG